MLASGLETRIRNRTGSHRLAAKRGSRGSTTMKMKLFTFATSPYARKVRMMLEFKGVAFEPIERCYSLDRKEDLRAANPRAEVPTLVLDTRTIADSSIICEYVEEEFPAPPLFPPDPYERARMRSIEDLCDRAFDAVTYGYWMSMLRKDAPEAIAMSEAARAEFSQLLARLEAELGERDFFCGNVSVADLAAICYVPSARAMKISLKPFHGWRRGRVESAQCRRWRPTTSA